jgi:tetratricopeptide (TPR) repeat protein
MARTFAPNLGAALALAGAAALANADDTGAASPADAAVQQARQAADADLGNPVARFALGVLLLDQQRDAEALDVFVEMTERFPSLAEPHNNIALLHARAGRWDAARASLEAALRNDPAHRVARENLGDVYLQLALQAWADAAGGRASPALQRKLKMGRELALPEGTAAVVTQGSR